MPLEKMCVLAKLIGMRHIHELSKLPLFSVDVVLQMIKTISCTRSFLEKICVWSLYLESYGINS